MKNEITNEWCAIELTGGKEYYSKYTDVLKSIVEGRYNGKSIALNDVLVAARGPAGTTVVLKNNDLIQKYRNPTNLFVGVIASIKQLDSTGDWARGLDEVFGGSDMAVVHRPEQQKPASGIIGVTGNVEIPK